VDKNLTANEKITARKERTENTKKLFLKGEKLQTKLLNKTLS